MNTELYALILAGGVGSRLWPRSRTRLPKQMLALTGERTLIQQTVDRVRELIPPENIWVMTNAEYVELVRTQLPEIPAEQVIGEPAPRGTAPAIGLGAQFVARRAAQGVMFALHADHFVADEAAFRQAMRAAATVAQEGWLVNLGVEPTRPETGYGYVELEHELRIFEGVTAHKVRQFREKPDAATAQTYVESGRYLWNSGIFCWRVDTIQAEFERLLPEIQVTLAHIGAAIGTSQAQTVLWEAWSGLQGETTIDKGIMEHAARVATVPINVGWNDIGAWDSLATLLPRDENGNAIVSPADPIVVDSRNVFVHSDERLVAVVGVENLIVVDVDDALLIMSADRAQDVKQVVNELKARGRTDLL